MPNCLFQPFDFIYFLSRHVRVINLIYNSVLTRPTQWNAEESGKKRQMHFDECKFCFEGRRDFRKPKQIRICLQDLFSCLRLVRECFGIFRAFIQTEGFQSGEIGRLQALDKNLSHSSVPLRGKADNLISFFPNYGLKKKLYWLVMSVFVHVLPVKRWKYV